MVTTQAHTIQQARTIPQARTTHRVALGMAARADRISI